MNFLVILSFIDETSNWNWFETEEEAVDWINGYKEDFYGQFKVSEFVEVDVKRKIAIE